MPKIEVNIAIYYEVEGKEAPVILTQGLDRDHHSMSFQRKELARHVTVKRKVDRCGDKNQHLVVNITGRKLQTIDAPRRYTVLTDKTSVRVVCWQNPVATRT